MDSTQSKLGENDIANTLAGTQRQISIAEFFEKNKHMLGFDSKSRAMVTAVKEAVDNALDATEEAGYLPDIYVEIQETGKYYTVTIEDNGPGITEKQIPKVFGKLLYGSRFHSREQSRGQQGIGISSVVLYSQMTSGEPVEITSRTISQEEAQYFELTIDTENNEPEIATHKTKMWDRTHGTRVVFKLEADMRSRNQLQEYFRYTAISNPHARLELIEPKTHLKFERSTEEKPKKTEPILPHPHGIQIGYLIKMCGKSNSDSMNKFLQQEFCNIGKKTANDIIDGFRDLQYGRELEWKIPSLGGINQELKLEFMGRELEFSKSSIEAVGLIKNELLKRKHVTYDVFENIFNENLNSVEYPPEEKLDKKFQDIIWRIIWNRIKSSQDDSLFKIANDATDSRKDEDALRKVIREMVRSMQKKSSRGRITQEELGNCIGRVNESGDGSDRNQFGEISSKKIIDSIWENLVKVDDTVPKISKLRKDKNAMSDLIDAMRLVDVRSPSTDCLSPIGTNHIEEGLKRETESEFYSSNSREAIVFGGDPIVIEAGLAYGGSIELDKSAEIVRFANRVPLIYQQSGCAITNVIKEIDWRNYGLEQSRGKGIPRGPLILMIHIASTNVPFTSESKDAIARIPIIEMEIERAIRDIARNLKTYLKKRDAFNKQLLKNNVMTEIIPKIAEKVASITEKETPSIELVLSRILGNISVTRERSGDIVELTINNYTGGKVALEITEMISKIPKNASQGIIIDMENEWFLKWSPNIKKNESKILTYNVEEDAVIELDIMGAEKENITVKI